jgi:hypothetical protein
MRIAFDYDKNYEFYPVLFDYIACRFQSAGHEVGFLTARHKSEGLSVNFKPDFVFFLDIGDDDYRTRANKKSRKMKEEKIDFIFDDRADLFPQEIVSLNILKFIINKERKIMTPEQEQSIVDFLTPIQAVTGGTYSVTFTPPPSVVPVTFTVPATPVV